MGMYTCLFGKVKFKDDVTENATRLNTLNHSWMGSYHPHMTLRWAMLLNTRRIKKHPDVAVFLKDFRAGSIGNGGSAYFTPDEYPNQDHLLNVLNDEDWNGFVYRPVSKELTFFCSLKNYTGTIEKFIRILPLIADDWDLYSQYEEMQNDHKPDHYTPQNGLVRGECTVDDSNSGYGF